MSLRLRLAAAFALVALITAAAIALTTPTIVGRGFARMQADGTTPGLGPGRGPGAAAGIHAQQVQQETTVTLILVALVAAAGASLIGVALAQRIVDPLGRLSVAASAVARGELDQRSGLADRSDEIGSLARSFDTMANELDQARTTRRRFFQDVVHELKTPVAVIDATTSAILDGVYRHEDRHLETIRDQSRLLARIVDDLRTISLAEAGDLALHRASVDADPLLHALAQAFAGRAAASAITLDVDSVGVLVVDADRERLRQALGALLDNAVRHTPVNGRVAIEGRAVADRVRLCVHDSGPGIDPTDMPHLFERFYQSDPSRDRSTGTSGLGLAIVKALVEAMGGTTGAENDPSGGARFWIELPRRNRDGERPAEDDAAS